MCVYSYIHIAQIPVIFNYKRILLGVTVAGSTGSFDV